MTKKGQAAMEFLMTYGWVVLVILGLIAALAFVGVTQPMKFMQENCVLPAGLYCEDMIITQTESTFLIRNGFGYPITINKVEVDNNFNTCEIISGQVLKDGERTSFIIPCAYSTNIKIKSRININYTKSTGFGGLNKIHSGQFHVRLE